MDEKTLYFDFETAPLTGRSYEVFKARVFDFELGNLLSVAWKWKGRSGVKCKCLDDYTGNREKELLLEFKEDLEKADRVIAYNGNSFDFKVLNTYFLRNDIPPPKPFLTRDPYLVVRKLFKLPSYSLNNVVKALGLQKKVGLKISHDPELYKYCEEGLKSAWLLLKRYNRQDVLMLEAVDDVLMPFYKNLPNMVDGYRCQFCNSRNIQARGFRYSQVKGRYQRYQCLDCLKWPSAPLKDEK